MSRRVHHRIPLTALIIAATGLWLGAAGCARIESTVRPTAAGLAERERVIHLLSRATYGVRAQDVDEVLRTGRDAWLEQQLQPELIPDAGLLARRAGPPSNASRPAATAVARSAAPATAAAPSNPAMAAAREELTAALEQLEAAQEKLFRYSEQFTAAQRLQLESARQQVVGARQRVTAAVQRLESPTFQANAELVRFVSAGTATPAHGALVTGKLERAVYSDRQLEEVMTDFWFNHFNVFHAKGQIRAVLTSYENDAIRAHVFGRFADMLAATAQHAAMMIYLDNNLSTAPPPAAAASGAQARAQPAPSQLRGVNENYARELLELHTLGVDGGYTQQDVIDVARVFTGWSTTGTGVNTVFRFYPERHDSGGKVVLGQQLPGGRGMEEGLELLESLARHPSTARFIATKLVRHFVADDPPPQLVAELAAVFQRTDGDLREVTRALFTSRTFYDPRYYRAKVKRPFEFVASALRVTDAVVGTQAQNNALVTALRDFQHLPYAEAAPTGYPARADEWLSAGAMLQRLNFALDLGAGRVAQVTLDPWPLLGEASLAAQSLLAPPQPVRTAATGGRQSAPALPPMTSLDTAARDRIYADIASILVEQLVPGARTSQLGDVVAADLAQQPTNQGRAAMGRAVALVLGSPDFQRY